MWIHFDIEKLELNETSNLFNLLTSQLLFESNK